MSTPESRLLRWRTTANLVWSVIGILLLLTVAGFVLGRITSALAPFVIAFLIVFFLQGFVTALVDRGMKRSMAVVTCYLVGIAVLTVVVIVLLPPIGHQLADFAAAVPKYLAQGQRVVEGLQARFSQIVIPAWLSSSAGSVAQSMSQVFVRMGNSVAQGILGASSGVATVFFDLFLGAVIAFWTMRDLPTIREELRVLAGDRYEEDLENLLSTVVRVVGGYLKGQTVASLTTGLIAGVGLAIIGVPYALVLGIITFALNYVPYIGPFIAGAAAAIVGLFVSPLTAVLAIVIVIAAQQLTDLFVTPRVMSSQVDLHPTLVIFSLLVGGALLGFWGMIFAIPVAATVKGLFVYYWERRNKRPLSTEDGALFRTASSEYEDDPQSDDDPDRCSSDTGDGTTTTKKGSK